MQRHEGHEGRGRPMFYPTKAPHEAAFAAPCKLVMFLGPAGLDASSAL